MLMNPRSEVEPAKALLSYASGPRFSFGSKASGSEDGDENRRIDCSSVHGSEVSMEQNIRDQASHGVSVKWRYSLDRNAQSTEPLDLEKLVSTTGGCHTEGQQSVEQQTEKDSRTRANTGSTIQVDSEHYRKLNQNPDQAVALEHQTSSSNRIAENDPRQKACGNNQQPRSISKCRSTALGSPVFKMRAQEISKAVALEVSDCLNNTRSSPEDLELIIQTRIMSLLNDGNPKKRKSGDAELDDSAQSIKRITCRICPKTVGRPCDLK